MKCRLHPDYKAIRRPRVNCHPCWDMYKAKHPDAKMNWSDIIENGQRQILRQHVESLFSTDSEGRKVIR